MGINELVQVGSKIKELRKAKGITQKKMAEILDIPYSTYSNYENNNREPNIEILQKISIVLGVPVYELLNMDRTAALNYATSDENSKKELGKIIASDIVEERQQNELLRLFRTLNNAGRKIAIERIEELSLIEKYTKKVSVKTSRSMYLKKISDKKN